VTRYFFQKSNNNKNNANSALILTKTFNDINKIIHVPQEEYEKHKPEVLAIM